MRRKNFMVGWMATRRCRVATVMAVPCLAQRNNFQQQFPGCRGGRPGKIIPRACGRLAAALSGPVPGERERALQNDPGFRRLSPERSSCLRQRLQHFSSLPPQQQQRMLNRMETWEHLTPGQKARGAAIVRPDAAASARSAAHGDTAVRDLRAMPPGQREQIIDSNRFKGMFSPEERDIMRGATRLPLAPPENGRPEE
jgi:hypothetical protein